MSRAAILAVALVSLGACASPTARTQVMLEIDAEPGVAALSTELHVRVLGGEATRPVETYAPRLDRSFPAEVPRRIALVPLDPEPARAWLAEIEARDAAGARVARTTVRGGYDPERTVLVRVVLEDACIDVACEAARCDGGVCVDPSVDVTAAPDLEE